MIRFRGLNARTVIFSKIGFFTERLPTTACVRNISREGKLVGEVETRSSSQSAKEKRSKGEGTYIHHRNTTSLRGRHLNI